MSEQQTPSEQAPSQQAQPPQTVALAPRKKRSISKTLLMLSLPLALAAGGGWFWLHSGRYVETENAYVQLDKVPIAPEVAGRIAQVMVKPDEPVSVGQQLFAIDDAAFRIALERARSAVATARLQVEQMRATVNQAKVSEAAARDTLDFQESQLTRQEKLRANGITTEDDIEKSRHALDLAKAANADAKAKVASALASLGGAETINTDDHPLVAAALAAQAQAELDLKNTKVTAPADGIVSQAANLQTGEYVKAGTPILAIVATGKAWVEANYNETDLTHMRVGQTATLELDAFPGEKIAAVVTSIGAGTGSTFSLLPAQNATGNWVKVVQRVPVRLEFHNAPAGGLRAGLSASVSVDTGFKRPLPAFAQALLGGGGAKAAQ